MGAHRYKTWAEAAGLPEVTARLDRPPPELKFPDDFPEPLHYDAGRRRLVYRGFMSSASYRFLHGLSTDPAYVAALDVLFQASADALPGARRRLWPWLVAAGCAAASAASAWALLR